MGSSELPPCIDLPLDEEVLSELIGKTKDWALMHGVQFRTKTCTNPDVIPFASFALLPTVCKAEDFKKVVSIQPVLNEMVHKIAHNKDFLTKCLKTTIAVDEFTRNLFKIYEIVESEGITQKVSLGLIRSDYMYHTKSNNLKQVELNTIASGLGGISTIITKLNRYVLEELDHHDKLKNIPDNNGLTGLCEGMLDAWKIYGKFSAVILFLVEDITYNISDQRMHEFEIHRLNPKVKVIRRTLTEIHKNATLSSNKELLIGNLEVAVIYFRAGYEPNHYHSQNEWDARLMIERSKAIKSPTIQYHLAGTKKVQQELAKPGVLEMFIDNPKTLADVRELFAGLYGLDFDELGEQAVQMALNEPCKYVLKPQREGGGNNIYGENVREAMLKMKDSEERTAWILMERITPPSTKGYMIKPGANSYPLSDLVSELGIFAVILGDEKNILVNKPVGHILRSKSSTADEGGVAAGIGAIDCPFLID